MLYPYTDYNVLKIIILFLASRSLNMETASSYENLANIYKENVLLLEPQISCKYRQQR